MLPIPVGVDYTAVSSATVEKFVNCEGCSKQYMYFMDIQAAGHGRSLLFLNGEAAQQRARAQAEQVLNIRKVVAHALAPCPHCGQVQKAMFPAARRLRPI